MAEGLFEKVKDFFGFGAIESYDDGEHIRDDFDDYTSRDDREGDRYAGSAARRGGDSLRGGRDRYGAENTGRAGAGTSTFVENRRSSYSAAGSPVVSGGSSSSAGFREPELVVVQVASYRDAGRVTPEIRRGDIVAFHLGTLEKAEGHQFLAFIMGVAAALDATVDKLDGVRNFALLPAGVHLTPDIRETLATRLEGNR